MNTALEQLFIHYEIWEKDCHQIGQMFDLLPNDKKQHILDNFETIAKKVKDIERHTIVEQEILLDAIMPAIEEITQK